MPSPLDLEQTAYAEHTVRRLQEALARGVPIMIPGSLGVERTRSMPLAYPTLAIVYDRRRAEFAGEGGSPDARGTALPPMASWRRRFYRMLGI